MSYFNLKMLIVGTFKIQAIFLKINFFPCFSEVPQTLFLSFLFIFDCQEGWNDFLAGSSPQRISWTSDFGRRVVGWTGILARFRHKAGLWQTDFPPLCSMSLLSLTPDFFQGNPQGGYLYLQSWQNLGASER